MTRRVVFFTLKYLKLNVKKKAACSRLQAHNSLQYNFNESQEHNVWEINIFMCFTVAIRDENTSQSEPSIGKKCPQGLWETADCLVFV